MGRSGHKVSFKYELNCWDIMRTHNKAIVSVAYVIMHYALTIYKHVSLYIYIYLYYVYMMKIPTMRIQKVIAVCGIHRQSDGRKLLLYIGL